MSKRTDCDKINNLTKKINIMKIDLKVSILNKKPYIIMFSAMFIIITNNYFSILKISCEIIDNRRKTRYTNVR